MSRAEHHATSQAGCFAPGVGEVVDMLLKICVKESVSPLHVRRRLLDTLNRVLAGGVGFPLFGLYVEIPVVTVSGGWPLDCRLLSVGSVSVLLLGLPHL